MHSSIIITGLCAALAVAKPFQNMGKLAKKDVVTDIEVEIETIYITVTEGAPVETPAPAATVVITDTVYADAGDAHAQAGAGQAQAQAGTVQAQAVPVASNPAGAVFAANFRPKKPTTSAKQTSSKAPVVVAPKPTSSKAPVVVAPKPTSSKAPVVVAPKPTTTAPVVVAPKPTTTAAPAATTSAASGTSYESVILAQHNVHRANHSANPLIYNNTLAAYAKTIASTCVWGHDMTQGGGGYGQNIVENGRLPWTGVNVASAAAYGITEQWYNGEEPLYASSFGLANPNTNADVLHFTQVVWKATTSVGCYTAQCAQGTVDSRAPTAYTVCNYFPQGNFGGQYAKNVGPGNGNPTTHETIIWSS